MGALTDLYVSASSIEARRARPGIEVTAFFLPALQTLYYQHSAPLDWHAPALRRLRRLYLHDVGSRVETPTLTFDAFLRILQECQGLEELMLNLRLWPFNAYSGPNGSRNMSSDVTVHLPSISMARFLCPASSEPDSPEIFHLLSHFRLPATAEVYVCCLGILTKATAGSISLTSFLVEVNGCSGQGRLFVTLRDTYYGRFDQWSYAPKQRLADFCTLFARSPLQELIVGAHFEGKAWCRLLRKFPGLRSLTIGGSFVIDEDLSRMFRDLMHALKKVKKDELLAPALRSLALKDMALNRNQLRTLVNSLMVRNKRQRKLSILRLRLCRKMYAEGRRDPTFTEVLGDLGLDGDALVDGQIILEYPSQEDST
ncbi:hypothetical protein DICSQDRAFT_169579 [Dichomitus squalens LYAD-421 SS1]|uniref:F-box domain-containing protein n=1 Tax=Dichomitus squalens (strain LYAD-421) TaxID=732165 RepID=R7T205_DICSQ|nr:uncharacterized protein DICSQDRAFT_169579 [Dichomitus squalens LYAD-421 SS1]EJF62005.1 hypothetical protein DICSQDRAFT_169579 [Dichomitus squalens LYAD-421 SS1]